MYCYCSFVWLGTVLLTGQFTMFLRTLLLTLDREGKPTSSSSSRWMAPIFPGWSSTEAWSAITLSADSGLTTVINTYLLDKEIDIWHFQNVMNTVDVNWPCVLHEGTWRCGRKLYYNAKRRLKISEVFRDLSASFLMEQDRVTRGFQKSRE